MRKAVEVYRVTILEDLAMFFCGTIVIKEGGDVLAFYPYEVRYTNSFVTFLSWIYWLGTHAFNAAGLMGALL